MGKPLVSVVVITYLHAAYIAEALNSIIIQECDFEYEIIVSNDCSPDNTNEIIQSIINNCKNPERIKYFNHQKNMGMMNNFVFALKQCRGDYIALCEGDDYWIDKLKLQKQTSYMMANPNLSFSFHRAKILYKNTFTLSYKNKNYKNKQIVTPELFLIKSGARYCTASSIFTKTVLQDLPDWFQKCFVGDYPLMFLALQKGDIGYLEDVMSVYRRAAGESWSSKNSSLKNRWKTTFKLIELNKIINFETGRKYEKYLKTNVYAYFLKKVINYF